MCNRKGCTKSQHNAAQFAGDFQQVILKQKIPTRDWLQLQFEKIIVRERGERVGDAYIK